MEVLILLDLPNLKHSCELSQYDIVNRPLERVKSKKANYTLGMVCWDHSSKRNSCNGVIGCWQANQMSRKRFTIKIANKNNVVCFRQA